MPVQCSQCKTFNADTAASCDHCGSPLNIPTTRAVPSREARRPDSLPEERIGPDRPRATESQLSVPFESVPSVRPPAVRSGPPRRGHPWRWNLVFAAIVALVGGGLAAANESYDAGRVFIEAGSFFGGIAFVIGIPLCLLFGSSRARCKGIVTHLHEWSPQPGVGNKAAKAVQNWLFELRLTDEQGDWIRDRRGFLLPVIEVEFRADTVHGPALEEGNPVVLHGVWRGARLRAVEIWNCAPAVEAPTAPLRDVFFGQVTHFQSTSAPDLRYAGQRSVSLVSFRLQATDGNFQLLRDRSADLLPSLPVEIRAQSIRGPIGEGDKIEVHGQIVQGVLYTKEIYNHSAGGAPVVVRGWAGAA